MPLGPGANHESLRKYAIEETYEVVDAIDSGDMDELRGELGDLLLQILFHAEIAKENGSFDINDVIEAISAKLLRRHPHVFGDAVADTAEEVLHRWEKIKAGRKATSTGRPPWTASRKPCPRSPAPWRSPEKPPRPDSSGPT